MTFLLLLACEYQVVITCDRASFLLLLSRVQDICSLLQTMLIALPREVLSKMGFIMRYQTHHIQKFHIKIPIF